MKAHLDCIPCLLRQAIEASRLATEVEHLQREAINSVMELIPHLPPHFSPPEIAREVHQEIRKVTGNPDPYKQLKTEHNRIALNMYDHLKEFVAVSEDPLLTAIKVAIAGNVIDLGVAHSFGDLDDSIHSTLSSSLAIKHYNVFRDKLTGTKSLLYLGDNAGEIVFDRILVEELRNRKDREIVFVVRGGPAINDATMEDAESTGMKSLVKVISNGWDAPATVLSQCTSEMQELFYGADMIIAKGQGNYESLSEMTNVFFLLKAKCAFVARNLRVNIGDSILMHPESCS